MSFRGDMTIKTDADRAEALDKIKRCLAGTRLSFKGPIITLPQLRKIHAILDQIHDSLELKLDERALQQALLALCDKNYLNLRLSDLDIEEASNFIDFLHSYCADHNIELEY